MKKKILSTVVVTTIVCATAFTLFGCGGDQEPAKYTVTYVSGAEAATGEAPAAVSYAEGETVTVAANTFTYTGYTFTAWSDGEATYAPNATFKMPAKDVTLTAQWQSQGGGEVTKYTVTFKNGDTVLDTKEVESGGKIVLPTVPAAPEGKEFDCWVIEGTTTKVTADTTVTGAMTVVIQWKDKAANSNDPVASETGYTVTENIADRILPWYTADTAIYYLAEGKPVTVKATLTAATALAYSGLLVDVNNVNGEFFRLRPDAALFTDHSGASWETQIANVTNVWTKGTVEEYIAMFADGASVVQVVKTSLENNVITHTVTSYAADDTEFENPVTITTYTITSTTDIHEVMIGVYMDGGVTVANAVAKYPTETNVTYNVTFDYNGGSPADIAVDGAANAVLNLRKDSGYTFGVDPVKTGYTFVGWTSSVEADALYRAEDTVTVTGEVTFTAQWTEKTITPAAGSILPAKASDFVKVEESGETASIILDNDNAYRITGAATQWTFNNIVLDRDFTIANNSFYFDLTVAGTPNADNNRLADIVFYVKDASGADQYTTLNTILVDHAHRYQLEAKAYTGSITMQAILDSFVSKNVSGISATDTTIKLDRVSVYLKEGSTVTVRELKVDESVHEQVAGSLLPNQASSITTRTGTASTVTGKDGGYEVKSNHGDWTFNDITTDVTINVATEGIYFDMTGSGTESAQFDIVLYDANGKYITLGTEWNIKYAMNGEHKGFISGASLLTLFKARDAENYTDSTTAITIKQVSLYLNKGCTLVVKELRTTDLYTVTYADGAEDEEITVPATVTVIAGGKYTVGAAIAREGYTFRGWLIGTTLHQPGEEITVTGNVTLTADWVAIGAHTVTYAGVEGVASTSHSPNATVTLPAAPAKTGYTFTGWEVKNGDETVTVTETDGTYTFTMPDADVTATAIWELNKPVANYVYGNEDSDKVAIDFTALTATENIYSVIVADVPNTVTTPTGTFFNGYLVTATLIDGSTSEGLYMPGETLDIAMASTVNITAVWQRLIVPVENEVTLVAPWAATATATLNKNDSVRIVADIQGGTDVFRGFLLDVQLNDDYYRFRTDGYIFTFNEKNSNDHLADLNTTISGFNSETYLALFANNAVVTQEAILTVENTTLTVVINSYAASDLSTPAHAVTYVTQISDSLDSRTVSIWADQVTATNAKVYTNLHYSPTQTASETNPITIGADNAGANTTAWVSTVRKGEKLILTGTQTSTGDNAWLMTGVSLFTKAQSAYFRGDNWVDGSTEAAGIHTVGIENWTISKGFSATGFDNAEDPWTELCALNRNCNLSLTVDWTTDSEIKVIISVAAGDKTYTDTFTITATEGELNDFYNLSVGYNASTASITSLVRSTNHAD